MKKRLPLLIMVGLVGIALAIIFAVSTSFAETWSNPNPGSKVEVVERDIIFDYAIPSDAEIAAAKTRAMASSEYQSQVARLGTAQAEKNLDEKLQADIAYRKEMNQKGSDRIQLVKVDADTGTNSLDLIPKEQSSSAWYTPYSYEGDAFGGCKLNRKDPINLFFWNHGSANDVSYYLENRSPGWTETGWPFAANQCAWTGNNDPGTLYVSSLKQQAYQLVQGNIFSRHHMRLWSAPNPGAAWWNEWSIANTHLESLDTMNGKHCVETYDGSEYYVRTGPWWEGVRGTTYWFDSQNGPQTFGPKDCGEYVDNDGNMPQIELTVNSPW